MYGELRLPPTAYRLPPTAYRLPPTAYRLPPTAYRLPPTAYRLPPTAYRLPPTAYRLPPTAYRLPPTAYLYSSCIFHCNKRPVPSLSSIFFARRMFFGKPGRSFVVNALFYAPLNIHLRRNILKFPLFRIYG